MSTVQEYRDPQGGLLAYKIGSDMAQGLKAYSADSDFVQVMSWRYPAGKVLQAHVHKYAPRESTVTQEAVIVMKGRVRTDLYLDDRTVYLSVEVGEGECMVLLGGGHGYEILDEDTQAFEIKNGPFLGLDADKEKF